VALWLPVAVTAVSAESVVNDNMPSQPSGTARSVDFTAKPPGQTEQAIHALSFCDKVCVLGYVKCR